MLFYIKCPTCSRIISFELSLYEKDLEAIINDPKKSKIQKETECSQLLDKYGYRSICCRIRIMGLIPYHKIVVT